jgi:chondroitin AC lyase
VVASKSSSVHRSSLLLRALILLCAVVALALPAEGSGFEILEANIAGYYTAPLADRSESRLAESLRWLESSVASATNPALLREDGSFTDVDYSETPSGVWSPWEHFRRTFTMARGYATPGQSFYRNPRLLGQLEAVLLKTEEFYGPQIKRSGNWWFWDIGPALDLGPALVLVKDDIDPEVQRRATRVLEARVGVWPGWSSGYSRLSGQNAVWSSINHTMVALLTEDDSRLKASRDLIAANCVPADRQEGIQLDLSFHQHGSQLYTGAYGSAFAYDVGRFFLYTRSTPWEISSWRRELFADYVADSLLWTLHHNHFDVSVIGRQVAYPSIDGWNGMAALIQAAALDSSRSAEISSGTAKMLETWGTLPVELSGLAQDRGSAPAAFPSGHRHFPDSDYTLHRRPGWFLSIRMFSSRTKSGERTNGESLLGARQSDGRMHLVTSGDEYATGNTWAAFDWSRLPGTTVEQSDSAASDLYGYGSESFVGGVSDGKGGVSAMIVKPVSSEVRARKAWVFFEDSVVFLTRGIESISGNPIETIVDQRPIRNPAEPLVVDGRSTSQSEIRDTISWAAADGIGYFFPAAQEVNIRSELREGRWSDLAATNPDDLVSREIRTLWIDHGPYASISASAEYVVVPDVSAIEMQRWVEARPITILANDATVSAARDERSGSVGAVFWSPGAIAGITVDAPLVVYRAHVGDRVVVSIADPTQKATSATIALDGNFRIAAGPDGTAADRSARGTELTVPLWRGRTTTIELEAVPGRQRTVRRR